MSKTVFAVNMQMTVRTIINELIQRQHSGAPVIEPNTHVVLSVISEADLIKFAAMDGLDKPIADFIDKLQMGDKVISVRPLTHFGDIFKIFITKPVRRVIVTDDAGHLKGIISRRDVMKSFILDPNEVKK